MSVVKAVLFDLDDTLFDHSASVAHSLDRLRRDHASLQTRSLDDILLEHRRLLEVLHTEVLAGRLTQDQARINRMRGIFKFCGVNASDELAGRSAVLHRERYRSFQRAVPGALTLLTHIHSRAKIGIVTNNLLAEQRAKLRVCGLSLVIDQMVTSEECGHTKPDAEIFRIALERLECAASQSVMVGDSWETDICGARNAGIRALWFNRYAFRRPGGEPVEEIASFEPVQPALAMIFGKAGTIVPFAGS